MSETQNKTRANDASVANFLAAVEPSARRADAQRLDAIFREVT